MPGSKTAAADDGDLGHDAVRDGVHHFRSGADDAAPFSFFADHKTIDVVKEDQRHQVLITVENEARGFFRSFRVDDAAELNALFAASGGGHLHVFLLVGDNPHRPAADARVTADHRLPILGAILVEGRGVHKAGDDFPHVVLTGSF